MPPSSPDDRLRTACCPVCAAPGSSIERFAPVRLLECPACGLVFREQIDERTIRRLYDDGDYAVERLDAHARGRLRDARLRADWTKAAAGGMALLDLGAGTGFFVAAAQKVGYAAIGVEPADLHARFAREQLGVDVRTGYLGRCEPPVGRFDVISMWHVLEHVGDPVELLREIGEHLRDGGHVVIEVPNIDSVGAKLMGGGWAHLDPEAHVCHFSVRSLTGALEAAGLEPVSVSTLLEGAYDGLSRALRPRRLAGRLVRGARLRTLGRSHPTGGELLRAVARSRS